MLHIFIVSPLIYINKKINIIIKIEEKFLLCSIDKWLFYEIVNQMIRCFENICIFRCNFINLLLKLSLCIMRELYYKVFKENIKFLFGADWLSLPLFFLPSTIVFKYWNHRHQKNCCIRNLKKSRKFLKSIGLRCWRLKNLKTMLSSAEFPKTVSEIIGVRWFLHMLYFISWGHLQHNNNLFR